MDIRKLLEKDHREVESLFAKLQKADHADTEVLEELLMELEVHADVEEAIFYPALEAEGSDLVDSAKREHQEAKDLIAEIRAANPNERADLILTLQQAVESHVEEEENEIFPSAGKLLGRERLKEMGEEAKEMKERLLEGEEVAAGEVEEIEGDVGMEAGEEEEGEVVVTGEDIREVAREIEQQRHPDESLEEPTTNA